MSKLSDCLHSVGVPAADAREIRDLVRKENNDPVAGVQRYLDDVGDDLEDMRRQLKALGFDMPVRTFTAAAPAFEKIDTVDGARDQAIVPGAEQDAAQADAKKATEATKEQELARLKGKQTKLRAGKAQEDPGGMFAPVQNDLLSTPKEPKVNNDPVESAYGTKNKLVTKDEADEIIRKMAAKFKGQLNTGIDPEMMAMGAQLAIFHIEAGARKFIDFAQRVRAQLESAGVAWPQIRPYVRGWYLAAQATIEDKGGDVDGMDSSDDVRAAMKDIDSASAASSGVESDRGNADAQDGVGETGVPVQSGGTDAVPGSRDGAAGERGNQQPGGADLVSGDGAAPVGTGGNSEVRASKPATPGRASGDPGYDGSDLFGEPRPDPNSPREIAAAKAAPPAQGLEAALAAQKAAAGIPIIPGDRDNIDATLPFLRDHQREDVWRAETRFAKPDGWGYLFTNGTGTGKGYVMTGLSARFWRQGKQNILIAVPSQDLVTDIIKRHGNLGIPAGGLENKKSNTSEGVVVTTYATFQDNPSLADRKWDLVMLDEAQMLMQSEGGDSTLALQSLRANSRHPDGLYDRAKWQLRKEWAPIDAAIEEARKTKRPEPRWVSEAIADLHPRTKALAEKMAAEDGRANVVFLSATPFAYVKTIEYAQGYLFDWGSSRSGSGYNSGDNREAFFMQHFGYRMRYNKLTSPDAGVDTGVMERQFHEWLKAQGAMSGHRLDVPFDYDRKFVLIDDAIGNRIDALLNYLNETEGMRDLGELVRRRFDYLSRVRLLEAIKAKHSIPYIKAQHALGRKVVVFHDFNEGGGINPFEFDIDAETEAFWYESNKDKTGGTELVQKKAKLRDLYDKFQAENPDAAKLKFKDLGSPLVTLQAAFPNALAYNGTVPDKQRTEAKRLFNQDGNQFNLIIVQSRAGEFGISLHDETGKHQRALVNLGLPTRPATAIQEEGRIYRDGQASDAIFRYFNTGTSWERDAFARKIAERASTAENLAMGNEARGLRDSFINSFLDSAADEPADGDGKGGKEADKATGGAITDWQRAVTFYNAQQKQRGNRNQREGIDYFPTPEPVGLKMVQLANIDVGEKMLEPSAGHGAIARFFPEYTDRTLIEPSTELASRAGIVAVGAKVINDRFESLNVVNKYDAIVMNPPYGMGGKTAMEHVARAMKHVRNGGRIVALLPRGPMAEKRFEDLMDSPEAKGFYSVAFIDLPDVTFAKAGTSVQTRIVVIEKQTDPDIAARLGSFARNFRDEETIEDLFNSLENLTIPPRLEPKTKDVETEADANGNITLRGVPYALTEKDVRLGGFMAKPKGKMGRSEFAAVARHAEANEGRYVDSAFSFPTKAARDAWIATLAQPEPEAAPAAPGAAPAGVKFTTGEVVHAKKNIPLYVAQISDRVERPVYDAINAIAKKHGGYYSAFKGRGAMPGFQFESEAKRAAFLAEAGQAKESRSRGGTNTPAFKKWFGESKVVDANGNPRMLYHGTADDFESFDLNHTNRKDSGWLGSGVYLTTDPGLAASYSTLKEMDVRRKPNAYRNVIPLYAKLENPYYATLEEKQRLQMAGVDGDGRSAAEAWTRELKAKGHDGVILRFPPGKFGPGSEEVVVFDEAGVKSPFNQGTWDGANPKIREARSVPVRGPVSGGPGVNLEQLQARLKEVGLADKVVAKIVAQLKNDASGNYLLRMIWISQRAREGMWTFNHELVHAFRDMGLIHESEWLMLKNMVRANPTLMADIAERYPNLNAEEQVEEAIADLFAGWKAGKPPEGRIARLIAKIEAFFKAIAASWRGEYNNPIDLMEAMDRGYIGRRDATEYTPSTKEKEMAEAWHGSPHDHDGFDTAKIGTGEGAAAYGWGLYFAGSRGVAEHYRRALSRGREPVKVEGLKQQYEAGVIEGAARRIYNSNGGKPVTKEAILEQLQKDVDEARTQLEMYEAARKEDRAISQIEDRNKALFYDDEQRRNWIGRAIMYERLRRGIEEGDVTVTPQSVGRLYQVDLAPAEDEYLLWDKPLSEQGAKVQAALDAIPANVWDAMDEALENRGQNGISELREEYTGAQLYRLLTNPDISESLPPELPGSSWYDGNTSDKQHASMFLRSLGIRGVKYLDGNSRQKNDPAIDKWVEEQGGREAALAIAREGVDRTTKEYGAGSYMGASWRNILKYLNTELAFNYVIFDAADVTIKAKEARGNPRIQGSVVQETAINKAIVEEEKGGIVASVKQAFQVLKSQDTDEWVWATADEFAGLRALGKELNPDARDRDLGSYVAARLSRHSAGQIEAFLKHGAPVWDAADQSLGISNNIGGLYEIVAPLFQSGKARLFEGYAYARRVQSQNLIAEGRENNLTDLDVQELVQLGQQHPEFVDIFDKIQAFKRAVNDAAEAMGLINAAQRQTWEQADHIPFYRAVEDDERQSPRAAKGLAGQSAQIRRLTGGDRRFVVVETATGRVVERHEKRMKANLARARLGKTTHSVQEAGQPIVGVIENLAQNITHLLNASVRNHAAVMAIDEALAAGWAKKVPLERTRALVPVQAMIKQLENKNLTIGNQQGIGGVMAITAIQPPVHPGNGIIAIRRDGQVEYYEVDDKLVYSALAGLYRGAQNPLVRFLGAFKNLLTRGVTAMPDFMVRNMVRDTASAWIQSEERGFNPLKETGKTLKAVVTRLDDPRVKAIMAAGGDTGWYQNGSEEFVSELRALERSDRIGWLRWSNPGLLFKGLERIGRASELANRLVQYDETLKATGSRRKAAFDAADIMDFQLKGGADFMIMLTSIVPFLNARIQGLYKLGRYGAQKKSRKALLAKAGIIMAFSVILAAINADDDDDDGYNSLPEYLKDTSWAIPIYRIFGKEIADQVGLPRFLLIPKPFELGTLFATVPERMVQAIAGNDSADATLGAAARAVLSTFAFNPFGNPIFMEIGQQWANKDLFRGEPIVGTYQQYLEPEDQYNAGTSQAARGVGKLLGVSPARLEHAVRGFTGTAGMWFLEATDVIAEKFGITPPSAKLRLDEAEILRSFVSGAPVRNSKWVEEFYNLRDKAEGIASSIRQRRLANDVEGAARLMAENRDIIGVGPRGGIGMAPGLDFDADRLSRISKQMKETRQSETMTPAQKREKLDELITLRNGIAKKRVQTWLER